MPTDPISHHRDRRLIYTCAFIRATATGMIGVLLGIYLAHMSLTPVAIGHVIGSGLAGGAVASFFAMTFGDQKGRRRLLIGLSLVGAGGMLLTAVSSQPLVVGVAAFIGMVNGMGRDRGAWLVLEQTILPSTTTDAQRTRVFAFYNILQDAGHAIGSLLAAVPTILQQVAHIETLTSHRIAVAIAAVLIAVTSVIYMRLTPAVEPVARIVRTRVSPETKRTLWKISSLFAFDSLAGGLLTTALLSFFFFERFGASEAMIGVLFFGARIANAFSHWGAARLAERFGLINTMVFTHIPSSLLLVTVPIAPNFPIAAVLFLLREGLVEMDVPTRQSYTMAVVRPEERTVAAGVTHLVRQGAWAVSPSFAGIFMQGVSLGTPLFVAAGMKIAYDITLYLAFRKLKPPEERRTDG